MRQVAFLAPTPFGMEAMTFARLREMAPPGYLATPQRPVFHLLVLPTAGRTTHAVDFEEHVLHPGRTAWIRPGQVQRFDDADRTSAGDLVLFRPDFLVPGTRAAALADLRVGPVVLEHPPQARAAIDRARQALVDQHALAVGHAGATAVQGELLRHLLSVLVLHLGVDPPQEAGDAGALHARFRELLERDVTRAHDVRHYAAALGCSTRTLARATQRATGQGPKALIQDRLVLEARRLLAHTALPVSAIARGLGFRDPSNFASAFAARTGTTPSAFRSEQRALG